MAAVRSRAAYPVYPSSSLRVGSTSSVPLMFCGSAAAPFVGFVGRLLVDTARLRRPFLVRYVRSGLASLLGVRLRAGELLPFLVRDALRRRNAHVRRPCSDPNSRCSVSTCDLLMAPAGEPAVDCRLARSVTWTVTSGLRPTVDGQRSTVNGQRSDSEPEERSHPAHFGEQRRLLDEPHVGGRLAREPHQLVGHLFRGGQRLGDGGRLLRHCRRRFDGGETLGHIAGRGRRSCRRVRRRDVRRS